MLVAPELALHDEVTADLDDHAKVLPIPAARSEPEPERGPLVEVMPAAETPRTVEAGTERGNGVEPLPTSLYAPATDPAPATETDRTATVAEMVESEPKPVIFPVDRPPDDPGAEPGSASPPRRSFFF